MVPTGETETSNHGEAEREKDLFSIWIRSQEALPFLWNQRKHQFPADRRRVGGAGPFLTLPVPMSQTIQNHPITIVTVKSQAISWPTEARWTSGGARGARAGSEPCGTELSEQKEEREAGLVVFLPGAPSYLFLLLISVSGTGATSLSEEKDPEAARRRQGTCAGRGLGAGAPPPGLPVPAAR